LSLIYRELGALFDLKNEVSVFSGQDALVSLDRLKRRKGMLTFAWENSGNWSCRCPLGQKDPPVYSNSADVWQEPARGFQQVCDSLNHFVITLALFSAALSAPHLLHTEKKTSTRSLKVPIRPLWLAGEYVDERRMNFYAIPEEDAIIMDEGGGAWLGSHSETSSSLVKKGVKYHSHS
jgi:hypothetical protein